MDNLIDLENEIVKFKENITQSNDLLDKLASLSKDLEQLNSGFKAAEEQLSGQIPKQIVSAVDAARLKDETQLTQIFESKISEISHLQEEVISVMNDLLLCSKNATSTLEASAAGISASIRNEISTDIKEYPYNSREIIDALIQKITDLESRLDTFAKEYNFTQQGITESHELIQQIYNSIHDTKIKPFIQSRLFPIYIGLGVSILLLILHFFI